jgi:succinate dehydrogenase / fumarate reductase membrane anchor subunit
MSGQPGHDTGTSHFKHQRYSAVLLAPLVMWFVFSVARFTGADHADVAAFLAQPVNAGLMLAFVLIGLYHFALGMQTVIEDYIHAPAMQKLLFTLNTLFALCVAAAASVAVASLAHWIEL